MTVRPEMEASAMRLASLFAAATLGTASLSAGIAAPQPEALPEFKTSVRSLAVFKNGLGFVFRTGETRLKDGWAVMEPIPPAALGTVWIGAAGKAGPVREVVSFRERQTRQLDAISLSELLEANVGSQVILEVAAPGGGVREVAGRLVSAPKDRAAEDSLPAPRPDLRPAITPQGAQIVVIETPDGLTALNRSSVTAIRMGPGASLKTTVERMVDRAKIRLAGNAPSAEITLAYLEKGITWSPAYLVNIAGDKTADITLEAVLANDAEDLEDADVSFVVGYPNFMFADTLTPLALQQTVSAFVESLLRGSSPSRAGYGGVMAQSVAYNLAYAAERSAFRPEDTYSATTPMPGESNEDLYFYRQSGVTLKKGDRARFTVFTGKVPCEHVYRWEVPDSMSIDEHGRSRGDRPAPQDESPVCHSLRLENTTEHPWTTAPAFTVNGSMPVAQDVLKYTPPGGRNTLKLTVATDVRADQTQVEESRRPVEIYGRPYDEITVQGRLTLKSWKRESIRMVVTKEVVGEVLQSGQGGEVTRVVKRLSAVNPTCEINWDFELKPGEDRELTYTYRTLVAR
jgi:hypothetical protein